MSELGIFYPNIPEVYTPVELYVDGVGIYTPEQGEVYNKVDCGTVWKTTGVYGTLEDPVPNGINSVYAESDILGGVMVFEINNANISSVLRFKGADGIEFTLGDKGGAFLINYRWEDLNGYKKLTLVNKTATIIQNGTAIDASSQIPNSTPCLINFYHIKHKDIPFEGNNSNE